MNELNRSDDAPPVCLLMETRQLLRYLYPGIIA